MGDDRRFDLFAKMIEREFPQMKHRRVADVAGGKGYLQAALHQLGFTNVTSWDKRKGYSKGRKSYRYGWFEWDNAPDYDLVVGMHPDQGTDHIVKYGHSHKVSWIVCPCCVLPSAVPFNSNYKFQYWWRHLIDIGGVSEVETRKLKMQGRNDVLLRKYKVR